MCVTAERVNRFLTRAQVACHARRASSSVEARAIIASRDLVHDERLTRHGVCLQRAREQVLSRANIFLGADLGMV